MALFARDKGGGQNFEPPPEGMLHGICYAIFDLGTQFNPTFNKKAHKVLITWELPEIRIDIERDGQMVNLPRAISKTYTLSLHEKSTLRHHLEMWRSKSFTEPELEGFDLTKLLGVNCTLQILHKTKNDKTYANIVSIVPIQAHQEKRNPENPLKYFSFEEHTDIPDGTPEWIADIIKQADEWGAGTMGDDDIPYEDSPPDDDIPF